MKGNTDYATLGMKPKTNVLIRLIVDEGGGEVLEYALIAGLVIVVAIALVSAVGNKVVAKWTSVNASL